MSASNSNDSRKTFAARFAEFYRACLDFFDRRICAPLSGFHPGGGARKRAARDADPRPQ